MYFPTVEGAMSLEEFYKTKGVLSQNKIIPGELKDPSGNTTPYAHYIMSGLKWLEANAGFDAYTNCRNSGNPKSKCDSDLLDYISTAVVPSN